MFESSFTLLRDIGEIFLTEKESIRFSIDAYHGYRYVSVRRYLNTDGFAGATRDGVTMTPEIVAALAPKILALPDEKQPDGVIGKFAKRAGICVVASIATFRGVRGLDLRQWEEAKGFTKKGIWIPLEKFPEVKKLFQATMDALNEKVDFNFEDL